ncbi:ABC transporter substrate-binding protein [Saccharibacillus sp. CPCC 101409]|uniref:ABC transporter substrate-binding protein n=1 Tax=Saccharibacillus sp. CPCC 101409 TaxID=3058041 RepID=UPI00267370EE|nr:ABC transporter substrate-binding protein [Saccharibacillus sp. CPCC 101409]MDO3410317.1 ABC transporter substrate-binding protein [Saccharibacillus sp. CPCC 101409]
MHIFWKRPDSGLVHRGKMAGVLALALIMLMLAACGAQGGQEAAAGSGQTQASVDAQNEDNGKTADSGSAEAAENNESAGAADSSGTPAAEASTRTVETVEGPIEIPSSPQRLVADEYYAPLLALGVKPIGTPGLQMKNPYTKGLGGDVEDIGDYGNPSMEKVLSLQPDMILTGNADNYEAYSKIAPTVVVPYGDLKNADEELTYFGQLFGIEDKAAAWLEDYDKRIAEAKARVDAAIPADASFSIIEDIDKVPYAYGDNFGRGGQPVYQALGRKPPEAVADEIMKKQWMELSEELLPKYAGDYIVLTSNKRTLDDLKADPLWSTLDAVKNDRVYVWKEERSWYYDPLAVLSQTEELADWLVDSAK